MGRLDATFAVNATEKAREVKSAPLLSVADLRLGFRSDQGLRQVLHGVSFEVDAGQCLSIVGESGSGKSVATMALMGLLPARNTVVEGGTANFLTREGPSVDLFQLKAPALRALRGAQIAAVFQDPMTALNPVMTVGEQIAEAIRLHRGLQGAPALAESKHWLERVEIPKAQERLRAYPHELSGGMRQRVMIAMALCCEPRLLIADEPTTALDVIVQRQVLDLMRRLQNEIGAAVIFITHDFGVVAQMADRVVVMRQGRVEESGSVQQVLGQPQAAYTQALIRSVPDIDRARVLPPGERDNGAPDAPDSNADAPQAQWVCELDQVSVAYRQRAGWLSRRANAPVVIDASLQLRKGETLALVGESGSGKSTLGRALLRLMQPVSGRVVVLGRDITSSAPRELMPLRRRMQLIFQDPYSALDPRMTIGHSLAEPLAIHEPQLPREEVARRVACWLRRVNLPADAANRYPHEFSGGQRQRIVIARALMLEPKLVVADEAVSSLDVSLQAEILTLLLDLKRELGLSMLFITHNLGVVRHFCDRALVMQHGRIVEASTTERLFSAPEHAYTRELIAAVPRLGDWRQRQPVSS